MAADPRKLLKTLKDELDAVEHRNIFMVKGNYVKLSRYDAEQLVRILEAVVVVHSVTMEDM